MYNSACLYLWCPIPSKNSLRFLDVHFFHVTVPSSLYDLFFFTYFSLPCLHLTYRLLFYLRICKYLWLTSFISYDISVVKSSFPFCSISLSSFFFCDQNFTILASWLELWNKNSCVVVASLSVLHVELYIAFGSPSFFSYFSLYVTVAHLLLKIA